MNILYTTARFPYPPLRGDQLVPYFRIKQLSKKHEVTLLSFVESSRDVEHIRELKPYCAEIHTVALSKWQSYARLSKGLLSALPLQVLYYSSCEYERRLHQILAKPKFDLIHTVLSRAAIHTMRVNGGVAKVCEMIDALSLTMRRRADNACGPAQWLWRTEAERMRRFEQSVCKSFDRVLVVSDVDRVQLNAPNVTVVPNGTDISYRPRSTNGHKVVILTGNFVYRPNHDAAIFLMNEIWPHLRRALPGTRLRIVGNAPGPSILGLARKFPDVEVTGFVQDLRQYLSEADVAVAPIRLAGGGLHNKALEAMACGTPVVASPYVTGICGSPGKDFLVAQEVPEYVDAVRRVLRDPELAKSLSENGRRLVVENYSWEKTTERLESVYEELLDRRSRSAGHAYRN